MFNIMSYVLIIATAYGFIKYKDIKSIYSYILLIELFISFNKINLGYFMKIGSTMLDYDDFLLGILLVLSLLFVRNIYYLKSSVCLLAITLAGVLALYFIPADAQTLGFNASISWDLYVKLPTAKLEDVVFTSQSVLMFIRVFIYCVILNTVHSMYSREEMEDLANKLVKLEFIMLVVGIIEFILKYGLSVDWTSQLNYLFGKSVSQQGGLIRLQGITKEPSYYALALYNMSILFLFLSFISDDLKAKRKYQYAMIVACFIGLVSGSLSFVVCVIAVLLMLLALLKGWHRKFNIIVIPFTLIIIVCGGILVNDSTITNIMSSDYQLISRIGTSLYVLKNAIIGNYSAARMHGSESVRLLGSIISLRAFLSRPLIGLGIGSVYCLSGIISIVASTGILGFVVWYKMLFIDYARNKWHIFWSFILLLPVLFCCDIYTMYDTSYFILIPVIDYVVGIERQIYSYE